MLKALQNKTLLTRIVLGVVVGMLGVGMLLYLVPQGSPDVTSAGVVAEVGSQLVTETQVRQEMDRLERGNTIPKTLEPFYAQQVINQLVYERMLEVEAKLLGVSVSKEELVERIRLLVPLAFSGNKVAMDQYDAEVQTRYGMGWQEFEDRLRQSILEQKIRGLVTDGITVSPEEIQQEFERRNDKIKIEYTVIAPSALETKITPSEDELRSYFEKNKAKYAIPERRTVRYALLDLQQIRQHAQIPESDLRAYYNQHIDEYKVENRVHVESILFKTAGKTDAEIQETQKKAEDVLKQAKRGAKFEDLAQKYSEDENSKSKGGDLGWIGTGQSLPEFEKAAFSLPKGAVSDLVRTQVGIYILKVLDRETARTKSFEEVRDQIQGVLAGQKADELARDEADKIADAIRKGGRVPLDQLAKQFNLNVTETAPVSITDPIPELGNSAEIHDAIRRLRPGEVNLPIRLDRGYAVISVKDIQPAHDATLAEAHDAALSDYRREKAVDVARTRAEELAKRAQSSEGLAAAAKSLGFEVQTSEEFARGGNVNGVGSAKQLITLFSAPVGQVSVPILVAPNWVVAKVDEHSAPKQEDFEKQRAEIEQQLLQTKQQLAYEAFRDALESRLKKEGLLRFNSEALKRLTSPA